LLKWSARVNFIKVLQAAFAHADPKSVKNTVKSSVSFYAFRIYERTSCTYNIDETDIRKKAIFWWSSFSLFDRKDNSKIFKYKLIIK